MYIPGRKRTGSRPSRTVMSFAVYAASAIKKALQIAILRARGSLPETAVGRAVRRTLCKARSGRPRDELAKVRVLDRGRRGGGRCRCRGRGLDGVRAVPGRGFGVVLGPRLGPRLGQWAGPE